MYSVYKITNKINDKCYIGSSIRVEKRWKEHINTSKNPNNPQYNYPLYQAFRKYGLENFSFNVLKDDFTTIEEMQNYEKEMIVSFHTLSPNGYNQTLNTNSNNIANENLQKHLVKVKKKCALVDKNENILEIYESYHAAARAQGWDGDARATTIQRICDGKARECDGLIFRKLDENGNVIVPVFQTRKRKTQICGINKDNPADVVYYDSISEAARQEHIDRGSIGKCLQGSTRYSHVGGRIWRKVGE